MRGGRLSLCLLLCTTCVLCTAQPGLSCESEWRDIEEARRCIQENGQCTATDSEYTTSTSRSTPSHWQRHIVRFTGYHPVEELHGAVRKQLSHLGDWAVLPRSNAAMDFPTDFALIASSEEQLSSLTASLLSSPSIRDIHPDRTIRGLLESDAQTESSGTQNVSLNAGASGAIEKKPGRLSTKWSIGSEQSVSDIVADLKHDAKVIQARRAAHDRSQGNDDDTPICKRSQCDDDVQGQSSAQGTDRHLLPWGKLDSIDLDDEESWQEEGQRRQLLASTNQVATALGAPKLWNSGFRGGGIRVGVFDTGIREGHPHIQNLKERSNWTHENTLSDELGHGTFVAGVISGSGTECPGLAPDVELHTFKVFTNDQVSFTSWFLDAFNYAIATKMQVVNLSIGGPDFLDRPFVDKVQEITATGIIMISAIGNDGPLYGTLNNPADQLDVIGVGGLDYSDHIASFSSRGMITWHLPIGFGGSKPDVMAYGREVRGSKIGGGCRSLSGTSVASPVVAGAVCLLASIVPEASRDYLLNPASMKQALVEGAQRLSPLNIFEQGAGKIDLSASKTVLQNYSKPRASVVPAKVDFTDCPYMWPYCVQPMYAGAQPIIFNATILNGMGVWGNVSQPKWFPGDEGGKLLDVQFEYSEELWPWSGHVSLFVVVKDQGREFSGTATGTVRFTVESPPKLGSSEPQLSMVELPVKAAIVPTPDRSKRVLWDQFHSIKYPPAYLPRDNLDVRTDILDWHGDHLLTNYHTLYTFLRENGMFVEILSSPYTCFNASQYAVLIVADSEEEFYAEEVTKLAEDVETHGLGLLLFPEWYSQESMARMHFFDDNTRSWWVPVTGGSNIPAVNDMVAPYGLAFGDKVVHGSVSIGKTHTLPYSSGTHIIKAPTGSRLLQAELKDHSNGPPASSVKAEVYSVLGLVQHGAGRVAAFGDASCVDANHATANCHALLFEMLQWATDQAQPPWGSALTTLDAPLGQPDMKLPTRPSPNLLDAVSFVANHPQPTCFLNSAPGMQLAAQKQEDQDMPEEEHLIDPPPFSSNPAGKVRQPKFAVNGGAENPSDYIGKIAPLVLLLAVVGTGFVLWIWTRSRKAQKVPRADDPVDVDASADSASVMGASRVSHRR